MSSDDAESQWLRGVTDLVILACLARSDTYGYALVEQLRRAGLDSISEATTYGALRRLARSGLADSVLVPSDSGPARRYYRATPAGLAEVIDQRSRWAGFVSAVARITNGAPTCDDRGTRTADDHRTAHDQRAADDHEAQPR